MKIYTSWRLMVEAGLERGDALFRELAMSIGGPKTYGPNKPISIDLFLDIEKLDTRDVLWSFRAVYPEQAVSAARIARRIAINAYRIAADRFDSRNPMLTVAINAAVGYHEGRESASEMAKFRRQIWRTSHGIAMPYRSVFMLAWIACTSSANMARTLDSVPDALRASMPTIGVGREIEAMLHTNGENELRRELKKSLSWGWYDSEGPGELIPVDESRQLKIGA